VRREVPADLLKIAESPRDVHADDPRWGYRYDQAWQFVESIQQGKAKAPTFVDGARCQAVLDAALESSETRSWVQVGQDRILQADSQSAFLGHEQEAD
jgi:predicted dehydrogenase